MDRIFQATWWNVHDIQTAPHLSSFYFKDKRADNTVKYIGCVWRATLLLNKAVLRLFDTCDKVCNLTGSVSLSIFSLHRRDNWQLRLCSEAPVCHE